MGKGIFHYPSCHFKSQKLCSGALNGVGTITNAVASGVSNSVVGTVGVVSDGVDAVANGVTGGETDFLHFYIVEKIYKTKILIGLGIKAVGDGVSGGIKAVGKGNFILLIYL